MTLNDVAHEVWHIVQYQQNRKDSLKDMTLLINETWTADCDRLTPTNSILMKRLRVTLHEMSFRRIYHEMSRMLRQLGRPRTRLINSQLFSPGTDVV